MVESLLRSILRGALVPLLSLGSLAATPVAVVAQSAEVSPLAAPLIVAARVGDTNRLNALIAGGADPNAPNVGGRTALMAASAFGNVKVVKLLLAEGATVNAQDANGNTALMEASAFGHYQTVEVVSGECRTRKERARNRSLHLRK